MCFSYLGLRCGVEGTPSHGSVPTGDGAPPPKKCLFHLYGGEQPVKEQVKRPRSKMTAFASLLFGEKSTTVLLFAGCLGYKKKKKDK